VKADWEKNGVIVEQNFKNNCLSTTVTLKKVQKIYGHDVIAICKDVADHI